VTYFEISLIVLTVMTVILQASNFACSAAGWMKSHYILTILVGIGYGVVEGLLATRDPEQRILWLFVILDLWIIIMGIAGLVRLRQQKNTVITNTLPP